MEGKNRVRKPASGDPNSIKGFVRNCGLGQKKVSLSNPRNREKGGELLEGTGGKRGEK